MQGLISLVSTPANAINNLIICMIVAFSILLGANTIDLMTTIPLKITLNKVMVIDGASIVLVHQGVPDRPIVISRNQNIVAEFEIERSHSGWMSIERTIESFETTPSTEIVIDYIRRPMLPGKSTVVAQYDIPNYLKEGCFYSVFSRSTVYYSFNLLQKAFGITVNSPKILLCIK